MRDRRAGKCTKRRKDAAPQDEKNPKADVVREHKDPANVAKAFMCVEELARTARVCCDGGAGSECGRARFPFTCSLANGNNELAGSGSGGVPPNARAFEDNSVTLNPNVAKSPCPLCPIPGFKKHPAHQRCISPRLSLISENTDLLMVVKILDWEDSKYTPIVRREHSVEVRVLFQGELFLFVPGTATSSENFHWEIRALSDSEDDLV